MIKTFFEVLFKKELSIFEVIVIFIISSLCTNVSWWFLLLVIPAVVVKNKGERFLVQIENKK
jgi:hypothetical protein